MCVMGVSIEALNLGLKWGKEEDVIFGNKLTYHEHWTLTWRK